MASSAADSQTIYSNRTMCDYDVHICYNGLGIEDTFISHLEQAFRERKISTTNDGGWNIRGEDVCQPTLEAIGKARSSVLVFCQNFPSKTRCLDELDKVLECEKKGQLVRVIYFRIDPLVVQKLEGSYGTAMAGYRERFKNERIKFIRWELSLHDAAQLPGRIYENGCQSEFIQEFVEELNGILNPTSLYSADCLAGLKSQITGPQNQLDSVSLDVDAVRRSGIRERDARNLPKAPGSETFFTISRRKEPENGERFIADQPSTSWGYTLKFKDVVNPLGPEGTNIMQYKSPLNLLHSEGDATKKRKWISNGVEFNVEANAPRKQILTQIKYFQLLDSRGIEDGLISGKLKGGVEAFSASVGVVNSTLLAVEGAGTVVTRTSEEVKSFMQTVTSKRFPELIAEGSEFKEHIEKIVLSFSADEKISPVVRVALDDLKRKFTCWSEYYGRANTVLETTAADLSKADKLQADFDAAVNDCVKAVSAGREVRIQLDHKLREKRELEEELEAVESEIADLRSSLQEVAQRKSELLDKGTKLKGEKDELTDQVPGILGKQAEARVTQELIEAYWLGLAKLFNQIFESEFGCS